MMIKQLKAQEDILKMYTDEKDERDWVLAWSGGKDSTAVLGLTTQAVNALPKDKRKRNIHVIMSDTRVENPILEAYMYDQVDKFNNYSLKRGLPMKAKIVSRPVDKSYFVLVLGRGYFMPLRNGKGRWCTGRLKIDPSNEEFSNIKPSYKLVGTRLSESTSRAKSIKKLQISDKIAEDASSSESLIFMPIKDWTVDDVWEYLGRNTLGWTSSVDVRRLYKDATGECGVANPKGVETKAQYWEACGARFGCWLCPVIMTDRSTESMSQIHHWLDPLTEWRDIQLKVYGNYKPPKPEGQKRKERSKDLRKWEDINSKIKEITKAGYNRAGKRMKIGQGTLTVEARKYLFDKLMDTQRNVNIMRSQQRLPKIELISEEEVEIIKKTWEDDIKNFPHLITNSSGISIKKLDDLIFQ